MDTGRSGIKIGLNFLHARMGEARMSTPLFEGLPQPRRSTAVVVALKAHATFMDMKANIETTLDEVTENFLEKKAANRKLFMKHRRMLLLSGGYDVLSFIWKESRFVSEDEIDAAGILRKYGGRIITAHNLAAAFSEEPDDVGKMNSKIRSIGLAANYFGLLERKKQRGKAVELRATDLLDSLMARIADKHVADLVRFCDWRRGGDDQSLPA
jgi:hypothetical protein